MPTFSVIRSLGHEGGLVSVGDTAKPTPQRNAKLDQPFRKRRRAAHAKLEVATDLIPGQRIDYRFNGVFWKLCIDMQKPKVRCPRGFSRGPQTIPAHLIQKQVTRACLLAQLSDALIVGVANHDDFDVTLRSELRQQRFENRPVIPTRYDDTEYGLGRHDLRKFAQQRHQRLPSRPGIIAKLFEYRPNVELLV